MKIEKVNDNQIRCTLTGEDLASRHIKLSELAYGSEKARNLFRDMIEQANYEFGFETNDIPLMVEAIPLPSNSIILIVTKVEYPDELDTRFSNFTEADEEFLGQQDSSFLHQAQGADDILDLFEKIRKEYAASQEKGEKETKVSEQQTSAPTDLTRMFQFVKFDDVCRASNVLDGYYSGQNDLYKDVAENVYYLLLHKSEHTPQQFNKVCNIVSEYGYQKNFTSAIGAFMSEHFRLVAGNDALQTLAQL